MSTQELPACHEERHAFLTDARVATIGRQCARLLADDLSWIERRKESIVLLDDSALRREISVDLRLRNDVAPLLPPVSRGAQALWCAPAFVLPKAPSNLMAFDLHDESGKALRLLARADNARISGEVLVALGGRVLGRPPSEATATAIRVLAKAEAGLANSLARRFLDGGTEELAKLASDDRFAGWLKLLAHSSLVVVLFRAERPERKLLKLGFEEPIAGKPSIAALLGWEPYKVVIDSSITDARTYHLEATAPDGMRIVEASQACDGDGDAVTDSGVLSKVHLYRGAASRAGAGTLFLQLRVASGLGWGALVAALCTAAALFACWLQSEAIAAGPSSAPALLLLLPGLIATFVARPDQHALTTRLLGLARWLLVLSAALAYVGAARVALGGATVTAPADVTARAEDLRDWFAPLAILSLAPAVVLGWGRYKQRRVGWPARVAEAEDVTPRSRAEVYADALAADGDIRLAGYEPVDQDASPTGVAMDFVRRRWYGTWVLRVEVLDYDQDTQIVRCTSELSSTIGPLVSPFVRGELWRMERLMLALTHPEGPDRRAS